MVSGKRKKKSSHPVRKKLLRWGMIFILSLLFLEFIVYFGSNIFLSRWAQRKINESTGEIYSIEFNRFNFSLIRRGFFMDGIVMKPTNAAKKKPGQTLFDITLDEIAFKGLWYDFVDKEFTIGKIYIDNPNVKLNQPPVTKVAGSTKSASPKAKEELSSPVKALEEEIKKTVQKLYLNGLLIKEVEIDHANFFFFNFLSKNALKAENTSLLVKNIDFSTKAEWKTPFNAEGFEFELQKAIFPLSDGVHTLFADEVKISSLDNRIDIRNFIMTPDRTKESKSYYKVALEELLIGNVDLNKAFMTSVLEIDELILNSPNLNVASNPKADSKSAATGNLNDLIQGTLKSVYIKELSINEAKFVKSNAKDSLKNRIELDELGFKMVDFYLGEDSLKRVNQFFYGQDAAMEIKGSRVYLGDDVHLLEGEKVSISSFKDEIQVTNLKIQPRPGALKVKNPEKLIQIDLTEFGINEIDLKLLYNEGILKADEVVVSKPEVQFTIFEKTDKQTSRQVPITEIIGNYMKEVDIRKFEVDEGMIEFQNGKGQKSNDIGFERFSFRLDDVKVLSDPKLAVNERLKVSDIYLSLDKYRLKLKDNYHTILADQLTIDSKRQLLLVKNLSVKAEDETQVQSALAAKGKTSAIDLTVPEFKAEGIDIKAAFYEEKLRVRQIYMPEPVFSISSYREKEKEGSSSGSSSDIRDVLLGYFETIEIDSVNLSNAQVRYESNVRNRRSSFTENDFSLKLSNFFLDRATPVQDNKTLFSDEIDLVFNNYSFNLAGGKYEVTSDKLRFNSLRKSIILDGLELVPNDNFQGRLTLGFRFPQVTLDGVDVEGFFFDNRLDLDRLEFDKGQIEVGIDKKIAAKPQTKAKKNARKKSLDELVIDTIQTKNSRLRLNYRVDESSLNSVETDFDLLIKEFKLDSLLSTSQNIGKLYSEINLNLKDFTFALPDSVHTLRFSKVSIGNLKDQILFSDFTLTPKDQFGKPGNPVIQAKIDQLILKNNRLAEIQETGQLDLREVRMINPQIQVFLDSAKVKKEPKPAKASSQNSFLKDILIRDVFIDEGKLTMNRKGQGPIPRLDFQGLKFAGTDLDVHLLSSDQKLDLSELLKKNVEFGLKDYSLLTPDSLYRVHLGWVDYKENKLSLEKISYRPAHGSYNLLRKLPFQSDAIHAEIGGVYISGFDPELYLEKNWIKADELLLQSPRVDLFRDKRILPDTSARKSMPQYLLEHAKINMDLANFRIRDGLVRYYEFAAKGLVPGRIYFDQLNLDLAPLYLRKPEEDYPVDTVKLGIQTRIMGVSNVNLSALMYFREKYPMDVKVSMDTFAFAEANDFLAKTQFIDAVEGTVTNGNWEFTLNDDVAVGDMKFGYSDLKIQFLDSLTLERGLGKLKVYTFGANLIAKNSNPRRASSKVLSRPIYQLRDKRKFVFSAWWKATFSGLKGSMGLGKAKPPKRREEEEGS